jgi:outer membrane protein
MRKLVFISFIILAVSASSAFGQQDSTWTLEKCIQYALEKNIQVRKGELTNQQNVINSNQARNQRLMSVSASASQNFNWARSTSSGSSALTGSNGSSYSINSGVTIFNGFRLTNEITQAELGIEAGKYSLQTTEESISLNILNAYLQVLYAEEQVKNDEKQIDVSKSQLNLAAERLQTQLISKTDYAQVRSQLSSEQLSLANAKSQLAIDKINLMQLMELPVTDSFRIAHPDLNVTINQARMPDVKSVYEKALAIKPQIKNASINKQIASIDEKIAKAGYYPTLSASAGLSSSYSSQASDNYFGQINKGIRPSAGFSLSVPIYQKNQVKTNVALAKISYQNAELSETDTKNQLRKSIEQACQDVISAQIQYEASLENYNAMIESSALSNEKFTNGMINSTDYLVSKTNLIVAESQLLQSKFNLIFSYKILDFYSGVPLSL